MIVREDRDEVAVLRIEHGKVNAIDVDLLRAVTAELEGLSTLSPRGVVLTGTGNNFSAGLDLVRFLEGGDKYVRELLPALDGALLRLFTLPRPVIAAVNGHAIAGGFVLACACDYRVVTDSAVKLGITELPVGVPFPPAPLEMVRTVIGTRHARDLAYSGRLFGPEKGRRLGFSSEIVPAVELLDRAVALAHRWGAAPDRSFELTKRQLQEPVLRRLRQHAEAFDSEIATVWSDSTIHAAMRDFIERTLRK